MLDFRNPLGETERARLHTHLGECPACAAVAGLERHLRAAIAPVELPRPSVEFEMILFEKLEVGKTVQYDPIAPWGWFIGWLTIAAISVAAIAQMWVHIISSGGRLIGYLASLLKPAYGIDFANLVSIMPRRFDVMVVYLASLTIIIIGTIIAIRTSARD